MKHYLFLLIGSLLCCAAMAQKALPFSDEIRAFRHQDSVKFPAPNGILFIGSSTFRKWTTLAKDFEGYPVINRGFGGSSFPDLMLYAADITWKYQPKQVIIYCGDNDLAFSDSVTAQTVLKRFTAFYLLIRQHLPMASIAFVSIKPSPSREKLLIRMNEANQLIRAYLKKQKHTTYIDVFHAMLNDGGRPDASLFGSDMLHMNEKGYALWTRIIKPYLLH